MKEFWFWRSPGADEIHVIRPNQTGSLCDLVDPLAPGLVAHGDSPEFATCKMCRDLAVTSLFKSDAGWVEVPLRGSKMIEVEFRLSNDNILYRMNLPSVPTKGDPVRIGAKYYVVTSREWWGGRQTT